MCVRVRLHVAMARCCCKIVFNCFARLVNIPRRSFCVLTFIGLSTIAVATLGVVALFGQMITLGVDSVLAGCAVLSPVAVGVLQVGYRVSLGR